MDEWGRADTPEEVEALIAKVPDASDVYDAATHVFGAAIGALDKPGFDSRIYLLWACFTDWVELEPDEETEAVAAMRTAAYDWPRIKDDEAARAKYFDHWMYDVMRVNRALPSGWTMRIEEVSAGVYRVTAEATDGRSISATGDNRLGLTDEVGQQVDALEAEVPEQFFAERQLSLRFSESDGVVWADLVSRPRLRLPFLPSRVVAAKYGQAFSREDAARNAVQRWKTEQAT